MQIIFHAGLPKTGTSFLQSFAFDKQIEFKKYGILFPNIENSNQFQISKAGNAKELCKLIVNNDFFSVIKYFDQVIQAARANNCKTILLSHEGLNSQLISLFSEELFLYWADKNRITADVLLFVRDPYDFLLSLYKQKCRTGRRISITEFLRKNKNLTYISNLLTDSSFQNKFNLYVVNYDKHKQQLKHVFLKYISEISEVSLQEFDSSFEIKKVNRSLTLKEIRFLQNVGFFSKKLSQILSRYLSEKSTSKESEASILDFKEKIKQYHQKDIILLTEKLNSLLAKDEKLVMYDD